MDANHTSKLTNFFSHPMVLISIVVLVVICLILSIVSMAQASNAHKEIAKEIATKKDCNCPTDSCKCSTDSCECPPEKCQCPDQSDMKKQLNTQITNSIDSMKSDLTSSISNSIKSSIKSDLTSSISNSIKSSIKSDIDKQVNTSVNAFKTSISSDMTNKVNSAVTAATKNIGSTIKSTLKNDFGLHADDNFLTSDKILKSPTIYTDRVSSTVAPNDSFIALGQQYINIENRKSAGAIRLAAYRTDPYVLASPGVNEDYDFYKALDGQDQPLSMWTPGLAQCSHDDQCPIKTNYYCTRAGGLCTYK